MNHNTTIVPYKLAQHLKDICSQHEEYANLLSVWQINRKACHDILENVILNYPHYTTHDLSHSESIITNIEMLLGEEAIRTLSPTDTWLLLQAAYLHDFGMVILFEDVKKHWETEEFQDYLKELENANDGSLSKAANYINQFKNNLTQNQLPLSWPIQVRQYVTFIVADYFRSKHASLSKDYIQRLARDWGLDLSYNGLIPQRLIYLLGEISCLHTESLASVLELDYGANGFCSDYIHPRFIAEMLRLGDLLDVDNNRFNPYTDKVSGPRPETSMEHIRKHLAATHIMISPTQIEYRADCLDEQSFRETQRFVTWLRQEVQFLALHWLEIMPQAIRGSAPRLKEPELLLRGEPDILGTTDLRFSISQEKAFEIIEGSNIYDDPLIFIRELIQNALDACKLQLWDDLRNGKYRAWVQKDNMQDIKPFHIEQKVYENYQIQIMIEEPSDDTIKIIVKDNGIGITNEAFQRICDVGTSYSGDAAWKSTLKEMPLWLKPTAGFGIGLQSVFLASDTFEIYSKAQGECIHAVVESRKKDGYVQIRQCDREMENGTEVHVCIAKDILDTSYQSDSYTSEYIHTKFDPITEENQMHSYKILDTVLANCQNAFFPIKVYMDEEFLSTKKYEWNDLTEEENGYQYRWLTKYTQMQLWDKQNDIMFTFGLRYEYTKYRNPYYFKGIELKNLDFCNINGCQYSVDFYGLNTKKYITLDRKKIKSQHAEEIAKIISAAHQFFLDKIWDKLEKIKSINRFFAEGTSGIPLLLHSYWCQISLGRKEKFVQKFPNAFQHIPYTVHTLKMDTNGNYKHYEAHPQEVWKELYQSAYVDLSNYGHFNDYKQLQKFSKKMISALDATPSVTYKYIIIDRDWTEVFMSAPHNQLTIRSYGEENFSIFSYDRKEKALLTLTDAYTKQSVLGQLVARTLFDTNRYSWFGNSLRKCIPAITAYPVLAVKEHVAGIANSLFYTKNIIISPITAKDLEQLEVIGREGFTGYIVSLPAYDKLLEFVAENQVAPGKYSHEEIDTSYRKLIADYLDAIE